MRRLEGRVAVVTGSGSGIGRATAHRLAAEGASVVVADLDRDRAETVAEEIRGSGSGAVAAPVDVSVEAEVAAMFDAAVAAFGGVDIVHNNAAATSPEHGGADGDVAAMDVDLWDRTMAVNARGVMLGCKHGVPRLLGRGGGAIVNTSSASGLRGDLRSTAYGASKAAVNALTLYVATKYGKRGIRCNAVAPGLVLTPAVAGAMTPEIVEVFEKHTLTPRVGRPEDVAAVVAFLASDDAAYVTGQVLRIDGGQLSHLPTYASFVDMGFDV